MSDYVAIYAGSFDPFTNGHLEIAAEAFKLFGKLYIAIGENKSKRHLMSSEQRKHSIEAVIKKEGIEVEIFSGLVSDYVKKFPKAVLVRGLRSAADLAYEMPMAYSNQTLNPDLNTVFLKCSLQNQYISSSMVREIYSFGGDVSAFVPPFIDQYLSTIDQGQTK